MTAELKPCPFCGAEGERLFCGPCKFDAGRIAEINCSKCHAQGPSMYSEEGAQDAFNQAREAWNRRAT